MTKPYHRDLIAWLKCLGATGVSMKQNGKRHPRLSFHYENRTLSVPVPFSPRNQYRSLRNMKTQLKHLIGI
jgi:hypothetical protein